MEDLHRPHEQRTNDMAIISKLENSEVAMYRMTEIQNGNSSRGPKLFLIQYPEEFQDLCYDVEFRKLWQKLQRKLSC